MKESMEMEKSRKIFKQNMSRIADSLEPLVKEHEKLRKRESRLMWTVPV